MNRKLEVVDTDTPLAGRINDYGGGSGGGDGMAGNLELRVGRLETDLARLDERSKSLATRIDIIELKSELRSDISNAKNEILTAIDRRFDKLDDKARWKWGSVIIPVAVGLLGVAATLISVKIGAGL